METVNIICANGTATIRVLGTICVCVCVAKYNLNTGVRLNHIYKFGSYFAQNTARICYKDNSYDAV